MKLKVLAVLAVALAGCTGSRPEPAPAFAGLVDTLSEPGGYFDSDNLVSNETAYLHVIGGLNRLGVRGGAFLGVGPEQNFSYIAEIQPEVALVMDIRRDNLLLHLLFKALFESSSSRIEYLARLFGRPVPPTSGTWRSRDLTALLDYIEQTPFDSTGHDTTHAALMQTIEGFGVPLTPEDRSTVRRFHDEFAHKGTGLAFSTLGRPAQRDYPTVRRLYLETDLDGERKSYLATEDRWQRVRALQLRDGVIPVVGDMGGTKAMRAIGDFLKRTGRTVSAFYVSNVEFYLMRGGTFDTYVESVRALPWNEKSVLIRSYFDRGFGGPGMLRGHFSSQHLQTFGRFFEMVDEPAALSYLDLVADTVAQ